MARRYSIFDPPVDPQDALRRVSLTRLKAALEESWDERTAYLEVLQAGNPALGQCYPTARIVQWFFPNLEIASGSVDTGSSVEHHFWNIDPESSPPKTVDLTWQQFPEGSKVIEFKTLDRLALGDGPQTIVRCQLLLDRVLACLAR